MRLVNWFLVVLATFALAGCAKQSPYINFGEPSIKQDQANGKKIFVQYVIVEEPKSKQAISDLGAENFEVAFGGKNFKPTVIPSSRHLKDYYAVSVVVDQGTGNEAVWRRLGAALDQVSSRAELKKNRIALTTVNGTFTEGIDSSFIPQPEYMRRKLKLRRGGQGHPYTYNAIEAASNPSTRSELPSYTKLAVVAILTGKPGGQFRGISDGVPLYVIDCANINDGALKQAAEKSGGRYVTVDDQNVVGAATNVVDNIGRKFADQYAISFEVPDNEIPNYSLTLKHSGLNERADYVSKKWMMTLLVIAALGLVLLITILALVFRMRGNRSRQAAAPPVAPPVPPTSPVGGYMPGQVIRGGPLDGDATTGSISDPGFVRRNPGDVTSGGFGAAAPSSGGGGFDSTMADYSAGPSGAHAGDVTIGSSTVGSATPYDPRRVGDATQADAGSMAPTYSPASSMTAIGQFRIESGPAAGQTLELRSSTRIGRGDSFTYQSGTLVLPGDPKISREHAEIQLINNSGYPEWQIVHKSQTNQTYVNDQPIQGMRRLSSGDVIRVGSTAIRVVDLMDNATMR